MSSRKSTGKANPGSTRSKSGLIPAIASQSPAGVLDRHAGTAVSLRKSALTGMTDSNAIFAKSWLDLLAEAAGDRKQAPSVLISEFSLGLDHNSEFHFETLAEAGIRVAVAPFFGSQLISEAVRLEILLVPLPPESIQELGEWIADEPETTIVFDLREQRIELPGATDIAFETHPWLRSRLLLGMDNLDEQNLHLESARDFRERDRRQHPWFYERFYVRPDQADSD